MIYQFLNNCDITFSLLQVLHYELMKLHHRHQNEEEHIQNDFLFSFFASFVQFEEVELRTATPVTMLDPWGCQIFRRKRAKLFRQKC